MSSRSKTLLFAVWSGMIFSSCRMVSREKDDSNRPSPAPGFVAMPGDFLKHYFYEDNQTYLSKAATDDFWPVSSPEQQSLDAEILSRGEAVLEKRDAILSYLVIRNGHLVKERYFHGSAADHSNNIHSASKGILSALVGVLLENGFITSLDVKLKDILTGYQFPDPATGEITLHNLLTMSAGFEWVEDSTEYEIENHKDWVQALINLPLETKPGESFNYSTGQSHLISAIIQVTTGMNVWEFGRKYLFEPLGVSVEHWGKDPQSFQSGGYNFYMTPRALSRFASLAMSMGRFRDRQILPREWINESIKPQLPVDRKYSYGYYWWLTEIGGYKAAKLWGYGGQYAYVFRDLDLMVIITSNTRGMFDEMDADKFLAEHLIPALKN